MTLLPRLMRRELRLWALLLASEGRRIGALLMRLRLGLLLRGLICHRSTLAAITAKSGLLLSATAIVASVPSTALLRLRIPKIALRLVI